MATEVIEAQVILPYTTGLPRDVAVNVTHWGCDFADSTREEIEGAIVGRLKGFYTLNVLAQKLSPAIDRGTNKATIKLYRLSDPKPRYPSIYRWTVPGTAATASLPYEVAVCVSYRRNATSGEPAARTRGRFYFGPLSTNAMTSATPARVDSGLMNDLATAAADMATLSNAHAWWVQYSRTSGAFGPVSGGYVDNEFDTQRRRGTVATTRASWTTA